MLPWLSASDFVNRRYDLLRQPLTRHWLEGLHCYVSAKDQSKQKVCRAYKLYFLYKIVWLLNIVKFYVFFVI